MSVQATFPAPVSITLGTARAATTIGSIGALVGAIAIFGWSFLNWDDSARQVVSGPGQVVGCGLAAAGAALLILGLPRLLVGLPAWAVALSVVGLTFVAADAWVNGTISVAVANETNDATFDTIYRTGWAFLFSLPKMLICLAGFIGLAVAGWRQNAISRPVCVLLAVGGLASLVPPFMPGILFSAIAFFLIARSAAE